MSKRKHRSPEEVHSDSEYERHSIRKKKRVHHREKEHEQSDKLKKSKRNKSKRKSSFSSFNDSESENNKDKYNSKKQKVHRKVDKKYERDTKTDSRFEQDRYKYDKYNTSEETRNSDKYRYEKDSYSRTEYKFDKNDKYKKTSKDYDKYRSRTSRYSDAEASYSVTGSRYDEIDNTYDRNIQRSDRNNSIKSTSNLQDAESMSKRPIKDTEAWNKRNDERYERCDNDRMSQNKETYDNEVDNSANSKKDKPENNSVDEPQSIRKIETINMRTGGAYIPPAKLRALQAQITDKGSVEYQRLAWEALKKSITGLTNKVNASNITEVVRELFKENIIRGRGVLARAIMQAQAVSPTFTHVYAALVAIINTKFPEISELLLRRLIIQFKRGFRRNDKQACVSSSRFVAHLLNQEVAHEVLVLEMLTLLLERPTEDSVEVAIALLKECGQKLTEVSNKGIIAIFERLRNILQEANLDKRVQYMIEVMFAIRKDKFKDFVPIPEGLDLVEDEDKYTHLITLDEAVDAEEILNVFKFDPEYQEKEEKYKAIVKEILGEDSDSGDSAASGEESDGEEEEEEEEQTNEGQKIHDMTETNLVVLRRNIYLTIQSSLNHEECAHKLLKMELSPGQIVEMCYMILDCCAQQRTYEKFYGLLAERFCQLNKVYIEPFTDIFKNSYETIHRLETNKLRNVAKFFAHLLYTDAISWIVLANIKLNEEDTTSSSRIFIKILFQELCEYMGLTKLNDRIKDITLQEAFEGLFPRDNPHNTRFAINFFTSIGLGGLTDELREHLKNMPKNSVMTQSLLPDNTTECVSDKTSESDSSSSSSSSSSSDSEESNDSSQRKKKKKKTRKKKPVKKKKK